MKLKRPDSQRNCLAFFDRISQDLVFMTLGLH